jgi:FdhD protein
MSEDSSLPEPIAKLERLAWRDGVFSAGERTVPEETAIAFTYNRMAHAVMMATPADLEDFAVGLSLSEGIVRAADEISALEIVATELGIELRMDIAADRTDVFLQRRRRMSGPSGCGLCGIESLTEAMRQVARVPEGLRLPASAIAAAMDSLAAEQHLNREARALHAAAFWDPRAGLVALREDVGRHNAVDKLAGALARRKTPASSGIVVLTSRVSIELVQKIAIMGAPVLVAVSAPTALAVRTAEQAGITLVAVARRDGFEIFTRADRILPDVEHHVA